MTGSRAARAVERDGWSSRLGVILAVAGSAVGLGNFLRFPGQATANGGGAFMVPYFVSLVLLGIPIAWVEWTLGRLGGARGVHSAPAIFGAIVGRPVARYVGALGLLVPLVIYFYYVVIESWCLRYVVSYLTDGVVVGEATETYVAQARSAFERASGVASHGQQFGSRGFAGLAYWAAVIAVNALLIHGGISRGVERFCRWAMPGMAICSLIVLGRVLTLGTPDPAHPERSVVGGLGFLWNPTPQKLFEFDTWLAAAGQVFFSLSVGFGVIITYASYLSRHDDIVLSSLTSTATNEVFEVCFGGLITVTAAFIFLGASGALGGTFGLGFQTLPVVFAHLGQAGRWIGAVWFFMLFLAAVTSSISMLYPLKAFVLEALGVSSRRAVGLVTITSAVGSAWVLYFSKDLIALDTMDFWVGTLLVFVLAAIEVFIFSWVVGVERGLEEAHAGAALRIPRVFRIVLRYVAPAYLLLVFAGFCTRDLPAHVVALRERDVAMATLALVCVVLVLLLLITRMGAARWDSAAPEREEVP